MNFWDPDQVDVIFSGIPLSGFSEQGVCKFKEDGPRFKLVKGVKGDVTRSKIVAKTGMLTIQLLSSSQSNDVLSAAHITDTSTPGGAGVVACMVRDKNGVTLLTCATAFVEGFPEINMGQQAEQVDWNIVLVDYKLFVGGT